MNEPGDRDDARMHVDRHVLEVDLAVGLEVGLKPGEDARVRAVGFAEVLGAAGRGRREQHDDEQSGRESHANNVQFFRKMRLLLATRNLHKKREISEMLKGDRVEIVGLDEFPAVPETVEDAPTLEGNARKKAREAAQATGLWSLA